MTLIDLTSYRDQKYKINEYFCVIVYQSNNVQLDKLDGPKPKWHQNIAAPKKKKINLIVQQSMSVDKRDTFNA